ncbi:XisI protein [Polyangium spumosum]|nr:XisI protein [Polyangium spumosum]
MEGAGEHPMMDTRAVDREVIERVLSEYAAIPYAHGDVQTQTVFDRERGHYLLMIVGREGRKRVHGCLVHVDVVGEDVVIQRDGIEHGIAPELVQGGIAAERIVLAFHVYGAKRYSELSAA